MNPSLFDGCKSYITALSERHPGEPKQILPGITISREAGAGAVSIARLVVEKMQERNKKIEIPWAIFDRNLVERVLEDHDLPKRLVHYLPEDSMHEFQGALEELLGLHPSLWTLFEHTKETILRLADAGHCILIGRGASVITQDLKNMFHVRLVAPYEKRVRHCEEFFHLTKPEAVDFVKQTDTARKRFLKQHFGAIIEDPLHYHLTINTGRVSFEEAASLIVEGVGHVVPVRK